MPARAASRLCPAVAVAALVAAHGGKQAELPSRRGLDVWGWSDRALLRAAVYLHRLDLRHGLDARRLKSRAAHVSNMQTACTISDVTKTIQIRDVPDDIHRTLRTRAAAAGVSLSDYLLGEISRVAARPPVADVLARGSLRGQGVERAAVAEAVRAGRERDPG